MYGIDYEDEDGEHELTSDDLDAAFHLLCKIEEALNSELNYYEKEGGVLTRALSFSRKSKVLL